MCSQSAELRMEFGNYDEMETLQSVGKIKEKWKKQKAEYVSLRIEGRDKKDKVVSEYIKR